MSRDVIHGIVGSPIPVKLKNLVDNNDMVNLTKDVISEFEKSADKAVQEYIEKKNLNEEIHDDLNRTMFTLETIRAVNAANKTNKNKKEEEIYR